MNTIYLISGPCGCGKSTLSNELASIIDKSFLITGDELHNFFHGKDDIAWEDRLKITWQNIIAITQIALQNQLNIIIDYVVEEELPQLIEGLTGYDFELRYIVLVASEQTIKNRITARGDVELINRAFFLRTKLMNSEENIPYLYDNNDKVLKEETEDILNDTRFIYRFRASRL
ncbi:MAG: family ATPase [Herbinix sp.]|jgi:gluconate kinase|nr:family ATPase [Herbinix sp.]